MKQLKRKRMIRWGLTVAMMLVIFLFSAQNGQESGEVSSFVKMLVSRLKFVGWFLQYVEIRKIAHFSVYLILGICVLRALLLYERTMRSRFCIALLYCFIYACTDEFHQYFVPGRAASIWDVLIDTSGALMGSLIVILTFRLKRK